VYKTTKYEYSTSNAGSGHSNYAERGNVNEINKLDTLLNDLEHERSATLERSESHSVSSIGREANVPYDC
jgi:hypothetical protein